MKKLIQSLLLIGLISEISTNTISCTSQKFDSDIWVVTDGGTINDQSFNQFCYQGANTYVQAHKGKNYKASYYELASETANAFDKAYKITKIAGAKDIILPGFRHVPHLAAASANSKNAILIDSPNVGPTTASSNFASDGVYNGAYKNVIGVNYEAEISAFESALPVFFYMNKNVKPNSEAGYTFGMFGGMDSPVVYSYMWGFISASILFNEYVSNPSKLKDQIKTDLSNIDATIPASPTFKSTSLKTFNLVSDLKSQFDQAKISASTWFSGGFMPGGGKTIARTLLSSKPDLAMAVAGGQISDLFQAAVDLTQPNLKIIGVDSPMEKTFNTLYPQLHKPVLTSAEKNIDKTVEDVLTDLNNGDTHNWKGKTITSPLTPNASWSNIEKPVWSKSTSDFDKLNNALNDLLNENVNYSKTGNEQLKVALANWFWNNKLYKSGADKGKFGFEALAQNNLSDDPFIKMFEK